MLAVRDIVYSVGLGYTGILYFPLNFAVKLKLL